MNNKSNQRASFYMISLLILISVSLIILMNRPSLEVELSVDEALKCNKRVCPIPETKLCCNHTLMPNEAFYCNVDDIIECD